MDMERNRRKELEKKSIERGRVRNRRELKEKLKTNKRLRKEDSRI